MAQVLGKAGINIEGGCGFPCQGKGLIHILVRDAAVARRALESAGMQVSAERDVLVMPVEDRAGALGEITRRIADAGVNVDLVYLASNTRLVMGASDIEKARTASKRT